MEQQQGPSDSKVRRLDGPKSRGRTAMAAKIGLALVGVAIVAVVIGKFAAMNNTIDDTQKAIGGADGGSEASTEPHRPTPTHVGQSLYAEDLTVTLTQVIDPAPSKSEYFGPAAGKRFVAVKLELVNGGGGAVEDNANNNTTIIGSDKQAYTANYSDIKDCTNFSHGSYKLAPGASVIGCVTFELPDGVTPAKVQFSPRSGFSEVTDEWVVP